MDSGEWKVLLPVIQKAARRVAADEKPKRLRFADWLIVAMYHWAVAHDRPQSWACERRHYSSVFRPRSLPSVSQFNRRMNHPRTLRILEMVRRSLSGNLASKPLTYLDGKPLTVGVASKDRQAARGRVMGGFAKGYKLHAWMSEDRKFPLWCVTPLNIHELTAAKALVEQVPMLSEDSLVLADTNYDSHELQTMIAQRNGRLLLKPKGNTNGKRHPSTLRSMGPIRRELLEVSSTQPELVRLVHRSRANAEGILGNLCGYGGGLTTLPPWVRGLRRVRRWVGVKINLYHARLRTRKELKMAA
jgi:hypothetical protein